MTASTAAQRVVNRFRPSEATALLGTALIVGVGTAAAAVAFIRLIAIVGDLFFVAIPTRYPGLGWTWIVAAPAVGGLLAGPIIAKVAREAKGHGVPEVMQAIALRGGRIRPRVVVAKVIASALCIGSGGSAGREGPIVQVGAALGSSLGQLLRLSENRLRNLVACGSAAGISATFNAPIAGVLFAMEVILGEMNPGDLGSVVVASVGASVVARVFLGSRPAFTIPTHDLVGPNEVILYIPLGLLAALLGVAFIKILYGAEDWFEASSIPEWLQPAIGGLLLGVVGVAYPFMLFRSHVLTAAELPAVPGMNQLPQVFGAGFGPIEAALLGKLGIGVLIALMLLKPVATSLTLGSGNSGGIFAPSLFAGAMLGGAYGDLLQRFAPVATAGSGAYAVVGMAAVFAAAARAPFTAILIVFEMTNDYRLMVPLMACVFTAMVLADVLHKESIYTLKLARRGIRLVRGRSVDILESVSVADAMSAPLTVPMDLPLPLLAGEFERTGRSGFAVVDADGRLAAMVSLSDYRRAVEEGPIDELAVRDIATQEAVTVFSDETVADAMRRMAPRDLSRLPVVSREDPGEIVGMLRRHEIVRAYERMAVQAERQAQQTERQARETPEEARFIDVVLPPDSSLEGRQVADIALPRQAVLVSIRRDGRLIIPHGDTKFHSGDTVTALVAPAWADSLREALSEVRPVA